MGAVWIRISEITECRSEYQKLLSLGQDIRNHGV